MLSLYVLHAEVFSKDTRNIFSHLSEREHFEHAGYQVSHAGCIVPSSPKIYCSLNFWEYEAFSSTILNTNKLDRFTIM